jgi:exodeoxyribonuclease-5
MTSAESTALDQVIEGVQKAAAAVQLNQRQFEAVERIQDWFHHGTQPHFTLGGYAGTGKSTVVHHILDRLSLPPANVALCAFTAKAARVLKAKTRPFEASTIHRLIYTYRTTPELDRLKERLAELRRHPADVERDIEISQTLDRVADIKATLRGKTFKKKAASEFFKSNDYHLIVADECSMIDEDIYRDLLSFGVRILFVGDPGQLGPIQKKTAKPKRTLDEIAPVDFLLTEIMRNDKDIVVMADLARRQEELPLTHRVRNGFGKLKKEELPESALLTADQIICLKNVTRRSLNQRIRAAKGFTGRYPRAGEKVVCKLNNHDLELANGVTYELLEDATPVGDHLLMILEGVETPVKANRILFDAYFDAGIAEDVQDDRVLMKKQHPPFDFGYVLTVHAAQGSEWDRVLVWDDYAARRHQPSDYARWLYTALTRARSCCVIAA